MNTMECRGSDAVLIAMSDLERDGFLMSTRDGQDPVAQQALHHGWWSVEQCLPTLCQAWVGIWPGLVLDVGAGEGFFSLLAAAASNADVLAFEEDLVMRASLQRNVSLNALASRVSLFPVRSGPFEGYQEELAYALDDYRTGKQLMSPADVQTQVALVHLGGAIQASVLLGSCRSLWAEHQPVFLISRSAVDDLPSIEAWIADGGYRAFEVGRFAVRLRSADDGVVAQTDTAAALVLVPADKLSAFSNMLALVGVAES